MLPMDYQYYLSAWIYKIFGTADKEFARFLHEEGYQAGYRQFRFFNYSSLDFGKPILWKDKRLFEIRQDHLVLKISFLLSEAAEKFIIGLFNNQTAYIGDKFNGLDLVVSQVERLPEPAIKREMHYRSATPVVIGLKGEEDKFAQYLAPEDGRYEELFMKHLRMKYQALPTKQEVLTEEKMHFRLLSESRSKLVTIKPDTPQQTRVKGYLFDFELSAPDVIHQLVLSCGAGEKGSVGFGWCEEYFTL